jgi:hypothetical protein
LLLLLLLQLLLLLLLLQQCIDGSCQHSFGLCVVILQLVWTVTVPAGKASRRMALSMTKTEEHRPSHPSH